MEPCGGNNKQEHICAEKYLQCKFRVRNAVRGNIAKKYELREKLD